MIGLVVTGHGHFADGLHTSAKMIAGDSEFIKYVNFEDGMSTETLAEKLGEAYNALASCDGIVVLSDLPGGSPFKTAVEVAMTHADKKIEVVAGTLVVQKGSCCPTSQFRLPAWYPTTKEHSGCAGESSLRT